MRLVLLLGAWVVVALVVVVLVGLVLHRRTEERSVGGTTPDRPSAGRDRAA